jgi:FixJ family two-component response regulator
MVGKVLFVDDEPPVLDAYRRLLHRDFEVDTALGGEQGLASISGSGPYAVVISDMRMPGMNGAQFLARLRQMVPETVRMLLTGYTDLDAAMDAVNEGNIFRFLTKPCEKNVLTNAINAGLEQYRLVMAEKELLEKTLMGSIKVLVEVLSAASPEAFGRTMRIARYVRHLVARLNLPSPWRFEAAAMLSQLGCVTLDPELIRSSCVGDQLSPEDRVRFAAHPLAAKALLDNIPRLEPIAWMIGQQFVKDIRQSKPDMSLWPEVDVLLGAKVLKLAVTLDSLRTKGLSEEEAIARLHDWRNELGLDLIGAIGGLKPEATRMALQKVSVSKLGLGMILQQEIKTRSGMLVVPKGQEITHALLIKLDNLARAGTISNQIMVYAPEGP